MKKFLSVVAVSAVLTAPVCAQDFDKGLAAHQAGDYATALQEWRPLAEQGDYIAQYNLGFMYKNGEGVPQDYKEAASWYLKAAEQGYASAQHNLGIMYDKGQGVPQDYVVAHMWYNISSANGNENGGQNRDTLAKEMTPQDISKAQVMARECMSSGYKKCGF